MFAQKKILDLPSLQSIIDRSPLTAPLNTTVTEAIALMSQTQINKCDLFGVELSQNIELPNLETGSCVLVIDREKLVGIFTESDALKLAASQRALDRLALAEVMSSNIVSLTHSPNQTIFSALSLLHRHRIHHLPVLDECGQLNGLITPDRIQQILQSVNWFKLQTVGEIMTTDVIRAPTTASVLSIAQMMAANQTNCAIVVEFPLLQPVGIITDRDIVQFQVLELNLGKIQAKDVMSTPLFLLKPEDSLWFAQQEMQTRRIRRAIVRGEGGELLGLVTQSELLQAIDPIAILDILEILQQQAQEQTTALEQTNQRLAKLLEEKTTELERANLRLEQEVNERDRTELTLRQSQQELSDVVENAVLPMHWVASDGTILWANQAELDLLGYERDEYVGHSIFEFHVDRAVIDDIMERLSRNEILRNYQAQLCCKDGSIRHVAIDSNVSWQNGQFFRTRCFTRDVSERKQTEEALRQNEQKFRAIFDSTFGFIGLLTTEGIVIEANRTALDAIGVERAEVIGRAFWETPWWSHSPKLQKQLQQAIERAREGRLARFEAEHILEDGRSIFVDFSLKPVFDETGKVVMLIPEGRDISDRELREVEHKQTEQKISEQAALLDVATDAILVRDLDGRIRFWNKGAERIYGWQTEEAIGRDAQLLLCNRVSPQLETAFQTVLDKGEWQGELRKLTKTGKEVVTESRWTLMRDEQGNPKSILSVDTDITERKLLEAQFLRSQRLESLGTLASGIAHDMNNILTPILAVSQLLPLKLTNLDRHTQQLLQLLQDNAKRGVDLVKQIVAFARGGEGQRTQLQIADIIAEVVQVTRQTFPRSIEFCPNVASDLYLISGDATQLYQVLMNLFINARDAMPKGGTLTAEAENVWIDETYARMYLDAKVGSYVVITVADTGIGISEENTERIFEPFFTTKEPGKGTGLGLSTVLGIIKSHQGFINLSSKVGQGTCLKIYLPGIS
jgi:PAS domain S-box-containing protein